MGAVAVMTAAAKLAPHITRVLGRFIKDPAQVAEAEGEIRGLIEASDQRNHELNLEYAKSRSFFLAGARPFLLWTTAVAWAYIHIGPLVAATLGYLEVADAIASHRDPSSDALLFSLLGLSGVRSFDKMRLFKEGK